MSEIVAKPKQPVYGCDVPQKSENVSILTEETSSTFLFLSYFVISLK